jgi:uncharacterized protein YndB with AHSA1/START domain
MSDHGVLIEAGTVRFERLLPGPIERVWEYLVDSEKRGTWFASGPMELRVGGTVELRFRHAELHTGAEKPPAKHAQHGAGHVSRGRVTRCEPPRLIAFTWGDEDPTSEVSFELSPRGERVLLTLTHRRLASRADALDVASGWHLHLDILGDRLHGVETKRFWSVLERLESEYAERL